MIARLYYTSTNVGLEPIEELAVVRLREGTDVEGHGLLPEGSFGAVVFVHNEGQAFEVEFTEPFAALVTLRRDEIEPTETTRATVTDAVGVHYRRR